MSSTIQNLSVEQLVKQYSRSIKQSFMAMNQFTDNLQTKVDKLLKSQQNEFVQSYRLHMSKISQQVKQMNEQIKQYKRKIEYYENEGRLAQYVQRIRQLQIQVSRLYTVIQNRDGKIKQLKKELQILTKIQKHSDDQIKQMIRKNIQLNDLKEKQNLLIGDIQKTVQFTEQQSVTIKSPKNNNDHMTSIETFATEIQLTSPIYYNSGQKGSQQTQKNNHKDRFRKAILTEEESSIIQRSQIIPSKTIQHDTDHSSNHLFLLETKIKSLQKQLNSVKKQNKLILAQSNRYALGLSDVGEMFWDCVKQTKKYLSKNNMQRKLLLSGNNKKPVNIQDLNDIQKSKLVTETVSYEQFKKEDKLLILMKLLENQSTLSLIYQQMFNSNVLSHSHHLVSYKMHYNYSKDSRKFDKYRAQSVLERSPNSHNRNQSQLDKDGNKIFYELSSNPKKQQSGSINKIKFLPIIRNKIIPVKSTQI